MIECKRCNRTNLTIEDMVKDTRRPLKCRPLCLRCKQKDALAIREKMKIPAINKDVFIPMSAEMSPRQKRNFGGAGAYTGPRVREPGEATGVLISKMAGVYVPEDQQQRNDGLKHIKSRGVQC